MKYKTVKTKNILFPLMLAAMCGASALSATPLGTAFTCQGRLN